MGNENELQTNTPMKLSREDAGRPWDRDASHLTRLGNKPVLKVCA